MNNHPLFRDPDFKPIPRPPERKAFDNFKCSQAVGAITFLVWLLASIWFFVYFHFRNLQ